MRITAKIAEEMIDVLEELKDEVFPEENEKYPFADWERKRERVKHRLRKLPEYVERSAAMISFKRFGAGRKKKIDLEKRVMLFLFARMMNKSNRDVEDLLVMFGPLFGVQANYKYIERLYSDEQVKTVLHNLFILLVRDEGVSGDLSGDGTGYSLTVTKHYRTSPKKKGKQYLYSFSNH